MAGVVFDAVAEAHFLELFEVVVGAEAEALGFEEFACGFELMDALVEFFADGEDGAFDFFVGGDVVACGEEDEFLVGLEGGAGEGVEFGDAFDFVAKEFDADAGFEGCGEDFDDVATDAEFAAVEVEVVAFVLDFDEFGEEGLSGEGLADVDGADHGEVVFGGAEAVDAGDGGDDDGVGAGEEGGGGGEAEAFDFFVDGGVFFDVGVGGWEVGFGLVVVEVGDEVFDGVVGEELFEFGVELCGEGFVVGDDEGGAVECGDDVGDGEGFSGAGDAEEDVVAVLGVAEALDEGLDGLGLVACGWEWKF